ncbi:MAG TPA: SigB/SigF/SigG family RNA polymerase sigma factor [Acidimicrobiales bacterium]
MQGTRRDGTRGRGRRAASATRADEPTTEALDGPGPDAADGRVDERFHTYRATGDRDLRNALIDDHRWLAVHCAQRFAHKGEPLDDLVQVAMLGVLKAVERFDPDYGVVFSTFAVPTIVGELRRHFRDTTWAVHVPRRLKDLHHTVNVAVTELGQVLGRSPTVDEIAERAGVAVEEVLETLEAGRSYSRVPLSPPGDDDTDDEPRFGEDDRQLAAAEARMTVAGLMAVLPERERHIVELRFMGGMTQSQIAERVGVSQVQVSRLLRASLAKMNRTLVGSPSSPTGAVA